jgi:lysyl-tRNA synthetase class 1
MFWADKLVGNQKGKQIVNDSWTPSGQVHMGSLKGPVIHDALYRILKKENADVKFMYGFDDADPIDGLPPDLQSHVEYLGVPLYLAPAPSGEGSFGDFFGNKMKSLLDRLGIRAELYKTSEIYRDGKFNDAILFVLENAQKVRDVYGKIYKKEISKEWFPLQVLCPNCGKLGTTKVTGWDGKEVSFVCSKDLVKWAEGCNEQGKINPLNGLSKMPYKVEWAAKWWTFGVTIEGAGKDHASAGGSYDVALKLAEDVFKIKKPLRLGYEFFLLGGKKMSSSKGVGLTGEELLEVLTPQAARFLMIRTRPEQAVEFDPRSRDIIPRIYDDYQKGANAYSEKRDDDLARAFELSQIGEIEKTGDIRFATLAQWVQMPNMEEEIKKEGLEKWAKYARVWIEKYAPESEKFLVQKETPEEVKNLSEKQKEYLGKISELVGQDDVEDFQTKIYEIARSIDISPKDAFGAVYVALLGKDHGPKAAWLISSLDPDFVKKRFTGI